MIITFGEYLPDLPPLMNPGLIEAVNVVPSQVGYLPVPGLNPAASFSSMGSAIGTFYARDTANNTYTYIGDRSALYTQSGVTFTNATRTVGGAYTVNFDDSWEFVSWGQTVIGVNGHNDLPQQISLGAATFVNLTGAPKARHIAVIKDFVVLGNVSDSATQVQRIRWSAINNSASWSADPTTLADFQDLPGNGGWVQKIISGEQGYIFQERAIWRMTFVGSPLVFQFDKILDGIGAYAPQSVVLYKNGVFFLAAEGFHLFDGSNTSPIGTNKVDRTFFEDLDINYIYRINSVVSPEMKCVFVAYPGRGNKNGNPDRILVWSWALNRWALIEIPSQFPDGIDLISISSTPGYTLDGLDAVSTNLDALPFSLDARVWTGGTLQFSAISGGVLYYFNAASPLDARITTSENDLMLMESGAVKHYSQVEEIWPIVNGDGATSMVSISNRDQQSEAVVVNLPVPVTSAGYAEAHNTARYHRFTLDVSGNFENLQGLDVNFVDAGKR